MPAWSFSALSAFETCPRQFYLTRVAKLVKEPESEALRWGNYVHKALEVRLKDGTPLPMTLAGYDRLCQKFEAAGKVTAEHEACIDKSFKPAGWWDKTVWCRSKWDVLVQHAGGKVISQWDWKSGSRKVGSDQLKLCAAIGFLLNPKVEEIRGGYVWLKEGKIDIEVYKRADAKVIWHEFLPRVRRLEIAHEEQKWPAKPSGLCRRHCAVGKSNCEHCGS